MSKNLEAKFWDPRIDTCQCSGDVSRKVLFFFRWKLYRGWFGIVVNLHCFGDFGVVLGLLNHIPYCNHVTVWGAHGIILEKGCCCEFFGTVLLLVLGSIALF